MTENVTILQYWEGWGKVRRPDAIRTARITDEIIDVKDSQGASVRRIHSADVERVQRAATIPRMLASDKSNRHSVIVYLTNGKSFEMCGLSDDEAERLVKWH